MQKKEVGRVEFEDLDSVILKKAIEFMYTGKMSNENDTEDAAASKYKMIKDILLVAEKFGLDKLKLICLENLIYEIRMENVLDIFAAADKFNAKRLEEKCFSYILRWVIFNFQF